MIDLFLVGDIARRPSTGQIVPIFGSYLNWWRCDCDGKVFYWYPEQLEVIRLA